MRRFFIDNLFLEKLLVHISFANIKKAIIKINH